MKEKLIKLKLQNFNFFLNFFIIFCFFSVMFDFFLPNSHFFLKLFIKYLQYIFTHLATNRFLVLSGRRTFRLFSCFTVLMDARLPSSFSSVRDVTATVAGGRLFTPEDGRGCKTKYLNVSLSSAPPAGWLQCSSSPHCQVSLSYLRWRRFCLVAGRRRAQEGAWTCRSEGRGSR